MFEDEDYWHTVSAEAEEWEQMEAHDPYGDFFRGEWDAKCGYPSNPSYSDNLDYQTGYVVGQRQTSYKVLLTKGTEWNECLYTNLVASGPRFTDLIEAKERKFPGWLLKEWREVAA